MVNFPGSDETTHLIVEIQLCVNKHNSIRPTTLLYSELLEVIGTYISLCFVSSTTSMISTDASHTTLTSAMSRIDIQSSELDLRGQDTPFPQEKFSDETLDLLNKAKEKLSQEPPKE